MTVIESLIHRPTKDLLRQGQGILSLEKMYGALSLEKACHTVCAHPLDAGYYKTIQTLLQQGLERIPGKTLPNKTMRQVYAGRAHAFSVRPTNLNNRILTRCLVQQQPSGEKIMTSNILRTLKRNCCIKRLKKQETHAAVAPLLSPLNH